MDYIREERRTPVAGEYDVIVVGGGPAGIGAAIAAGRAGARTLLIEKYGCLGGMWTSGLVNPLFDYKNKGGLVQEIVDRLDAAGQSVLVAGGMYDFDIEEMKYLLDEMTGEAHVEILFYSYFADVLKDGARINGVLVENKAGRQAYRAGVVIDCTGDGDVAARFGVPCEIGRPGDHACQAMTLMYRMSGFDFYQRGARELYERMVEAGRAHGVTDYDYNFDQPWILKLPAPHAGVCQMTHMRGYDGLDPVDLSAALIEGRRRVHDAVRFLQCHVPEFVDMHLDQTAEMLGVRETRRIHGLYELTMDDLREGRRFEDGICVCAFNVDIHQPDGTSQEKSEDYRMKPYHIPYRCLVPVGADNLLMAGRCISGSFEAHASYRVTGDCVAMGQAAGTAAALALSRGVSTAALDGRDVAAAMVRQGAKV